MPGDRLTPWVERLTWVFTYGGLATLALGVATWRFDTTAAWTLIVAGAVLAAAGIVLIWVRSRSNDDRAA